MAKKRELTPQQIHFALLYSAGDKSAVDCAKLCGFQSAKNQAHRLLQDERIGGIVAEQKRYQAERLGWSAEKVIARMANIFEEAFRQGQYTPAINALSKLGSWVGLSDRTSSSHVTVDIGFEKLLERASGAIDITPSDVSLLTESKTSPEK